MEYEDNISEHDTVSNISTDGTDSDCYIINVKKLALIPMTDEEIDSNHKSIKHQRKLLRQRKERYTKAMKEQLMREVNFEKALLYDAGK